MYVGNVYKFSGENISEDIGQSTQHQHQAVERQIVKGASNICKQQTNC